MWLITTQGFYSGVQDPHDPNIIVVRCRVHADAKALVEMLPKADRPRIIDNEGTDYPYRVKLSRAAWTRLVAELAIEVDYGNFKDAVKARQGKDRADTYMRVWNALYYLTPQRTRRAFRRRVDRRHDEQLRMAGGAPWWEDDGAGFHDLTDVHRGDR